MNKLESYMLRLAVLAVVLFGVVWYFLSATVAEAPKVRKDIEVVAGLSDFSKPITAEIKDSITVENISQKFALAKIKYERPTFSRAFGARSKEVRLILANMFGGGEDTENAVEMALDYLARTQTENGSWSPKKYPLGSTGLALNAFLGAGYHHLGGKHQKVVAKGIEYMLKKQTESGKMNSGNLYAAGIAGVVFAEAYGLTGDSRCREAAERMVAYLASCQGPKGAWAYNGWTPDKGDAYAYDTSVTGWVVMAFKSAKLAGLAVPKKTIDNYLKYAMLVTNTEGTKKFDGKMVNLRGTSFYGTGKTGKLNRTSHNHTMTASTLMCRLYMGHDKSSPLVAEGLLHITRDLPKRLRPVWSNKKGQNNVYMWYHAAQVGFLTHGKEWRFWNKNLRKILIENQVKEGSTKGSWPVETFKWARGSAAYATAMNVLILETYYRYYK